MILTVIVSLEGDEDEVEAFYEQMNEGLDNMVEDGEDDVIVQVRREDFVVMGAFGFGPKGDANERIAEALERKTGVPFRAAEEEHVHETHGGSGSDDRL